MDYYTQELEYKPQDSHVIAWRYNKLVVARQMGQITKRQFSFMVNSLYGKFARYPAPVTVQLE